GGGDDGKGDGPKKKKNRPSQKQRKRLAAQREAANRGADEEAGPPAEVKQEASEAYARGTLASVRSRLRTWDAALRHLEKAGVVKRDPRYEVHPSLAWAARLAKRLSVPLALWERLLVTGVWHLLRADELASLRVGDVVFVTVEGRPTAALRVAKSKTDQAGHGTVVARACSEGRLPHCPACCLKEQWEARVGQLARARSVGSQEARLFLGDSGLPLTTAQISGLVEDYAAAKGIPVKAEDGSRLYGSHSLR
ncbi:unnamed protein product, partial [Symbiodinium sp. KB8]